MWLNKDRIRRENGKEDGEIGNIVLLAPPTPFPPLDQVISGGTVELRSKMRYAEST
jgi:hypothetical protein